MKNKLKDTFKCEKQFCFFFFQVFSPSTLRLFSPTVENRSPIAFISEEPAEIIRKCTYNEVPLMIGYASREGLLAEIAEKNGLIIKVAEDGHILPFWLNINKDTGLYKSLENEVRKCYFDNKEPMKGTESYALVCMIIFFGNTLKS